MGAQENSPDLWRDHLPTLKLDGHKYNRGHAVILAGSDFTGATRLASEACLRTGAGLVTTVAHKYADVYRASLLPDIMVTDAPLKPSEYIKAVLAGPGGASEGDNIFIRKNPYKSARIFDANAIPTKRDFHCLDERSILTPHEGEFGITFPDIDLSDRSAAALEAAKITGAIVVLKGAPTIIAAPDDRSVINTHASPYLAKAGTGDVLAGIITGLAAQGMPEFPAACAAVWIHGEIGQRIKTGLIASDMAVEIPKVMATI